MTKTSQGNHQLLELQKRLGKKTTPLLLADKRLQ
jgi:hypothetical protein